MKPLAEHLNRSIPPDTGYQAELDKFRGALASGRDLETALLEVSTNDDLDRKIVDETHNFIYEADLEFYRQQAEGKIRNPLSDLLLYLNRTASPTVKIVTTNYDRVAEYAIEQVGLACSTGFEGRYFGQYVGFGQGSRIRGSIELLKVHGSLDWYSSASGLACSFPNRELTSPDFRPLIVTPGTRKYEHTHNDPFRGIIARSDIAFETAPSIVCVGYGFNDIHIQPRLVRRIQNEKIPVTILALNLTAKARQFIDSSVNRDVVGIESSKTGCTLRFPNGFSKESALPIWDLRELLKIVI
jgi:hypothetical protein